MPKVLIVDDSLSVRRALERVLSAKDFEVVAARSGEEALERFAAVSPDLTIADVIMPGIGGFELCRKLRERNPKTPVILISGVGDAQIERQARAVGAAAIIPKPFSPEDLSAALGAALNPPEPQLSDPETPGPEAAAPAELPDADADTELPDADLSVTNAVLPVTDPHDAGPQGSSTQNVDPQELDLQDSDTQEPDLPAADLQPSPQASETHGLRASNLQDADSAGDDVSDAEPQGELQNASPVEPALPEPDLQPATKPDLAAPLNRFLEKPEVLAATLSDRQGVCLAHVGEHPSDAEALASYSRFLLVASDVLGTHYGADHTNGVVLEFPQCALYLGRVDAEHILSLHLSDAKALSVVRYLMNRTLPELALELRNLRA